MKELNDRIDRICFLIDRLTSQIMLLEDKVKWLELRDVRLKG